VIVLGCVRHDRVGWCNILATIAVVFVVTGVLWLLPYSFWLLDYPVVSVTVVLCSN